MTEMTAETIPPASNSFTILVAIVFVVTSVVLFKDNHVAAMEDLSGGIFTDRVLAVVAAAALLASSVAVLLAFPERLQVVDEGLVSVRGVFRTSRSVRSKATIEVVMIEPRQLTSNGLAVSVRDVWIDGSSGRKRLCRYPAGGRAEALAARCAEAWDAEVVPWSRPG